MVQNAAPVASLENPAAGSKFDAGAVVTLQGSVQDREDAATDLVVRWYAGNQEICTDSVAATDGSITCAWTAEEGVDKLRLRVEDSAGEGDEEAVAISVVDDLPPEIEITSPTASTTLYSDIDVALAAVVADGETEPGDLLVAWTDADGVVIAAPTPDSSGAANAFVRLAEGGPYQLTATVTDGAGQTGESVVSVIVHGPNTPPTCAFDSPAEAERFDPGETILFTGTCTDAESNPDELLGTLSSSLDGERTATLPLDSSGAFTWPDAGLSVGTHVMLLSVADPLGEAYTASLVVEVCGDVWYPDSDGDSFGDSGGGVSACEAPSGYVAVSGDCDDGDAFTAPGMAFNDSSSECMLDADGDGWGDASPPAAATAGSDCDDAVATISPDGVEVCDGVDNDCDGGTDDTAAVDATIWYDDGDADGYGDPSSSTFGCTQPPGYVDDATDCDPTDSGVNPSANETCDGIDNDCDSLVDDDDSGVTGATTWYADADGDGYGATTTSAFQCDAPGGYLADNTDCNDGDAAVNAAATEVCDEIDNDCDDDVDDDDTSLDATSTTTWYIDADADGYGSTAASLDACDKPAGYDDDALDCDDADASVSPAEAEVWYDGLDTDCDGSTGADDYDADGDGIADDVAFTDADAELVGSSAGDQVANSLRYLGDLDGNGYDDLFVAGHSASPGGLADAGSGYFFSGPITGDFDVTDAAGTFVGTAAGDQAGSMAANVGDVDGDGVDEVAITISAYDLGSNTDNGAVAFFFGGVVGEETMGDADAILYGPPYNTAYAGVAASGGDTDSDGRSEVLVGVVYDDHGGDGAGAVYLISDSTLAGGVSDAVTSVYASLWYGDDSGDNAGRSVCTLDYTGDAGPEFATGANSAGSGGKVYVVDHRAAPSGALGSTTVGAVVFSGSAGGSVGGVVACPGDVTGDGRDDLLAASGTSATGAGQVFVIGGDTISGDLDSAAWATVDGEYASEPTGFGQSLSFGDWDADGETDIAIGAGEDAGGSAGEAYVVFGPLGAGANDLASLDHVRLSGAAGMRLGISVALDGDANGDGFSDLAAGSDLYSAYRGGVWMLFGSPW